MERRARDPAKELRMVHGQRGPLEPGKLFEELVLPIMDDLYRLACRMELDPHRGEDLLQEGLILGFRKFAQLRSPGSFRAWMASILRHTWLNRRRARSQTLSLDAGAADAVAEVPADAEVTDPEMRFM